MVDLKSIPPGMIRLSYWVDFHQRMGRTGRWMNVLKDEDDEGKVWASVKQLRAWHHAHQVRVMKYDPLDDYQSEIFKGSEWDREGTMVVSDAKDWGQHLPDWMFRDVESGDREPPPTRTSGLMR